jgi:hypothetical protein
VKTPAAVLLSACLSCGSKASVTVSATIDPPMLSVSGSSALAVALSGTFTVHLELGQFSPSGTDATFQAFSLEASNRSVLLQLDTVAMPAGAVHLEPGQKTDVEFKVTDGSSANAQAITKAQATQICGAGMAQIQGSISDTASGGSTPVQSASFALTGPGCPP